MPKNEVFSRLLLLRTWRGMLSSLSTAEPPSQWLDFLLGKLLNTYQVCLNSLMCKPKSQEFFASTAKAHYEGLALSYVCIGS